MKSRIPEKKSDFRLKSLLILKEWFHFYIRKNAINNNKSKYVTNYTIDSKKHHLETSEQYKIAIDPFDDKGIRVCNGEFWFFSR